MAHLHYIKVKETYDNGNHQYHFTSKCLGCQKDFPIMVGGEDLHRYHNGEGHLQTLFPYLAPWERELLFQSGLCNTCFDNLFSEEDEEDED